MSYESDLLVWLPHLTRYARALTGERAWADDLVQDTLERALNRPPRDTANLRAWLLTLLRHRFIDQLRARHEIAVDDATAPWQTMAAPGGEIGGPSSCHSGRISRSTPWSRWNCSPTTRRRRSLVCGTAP